MIRRFLSAAIVLLLSCASAFAQQTTGNVTGRVLDAQGAAIPGATVTAKSAATGFTRTEVSDPEGLYRLTGLPVGHVRHHGGTSRLHDDLEQGHRGERRSDGHARLLAEGRFGCRDGQRHRHLAAHRNDCVISRRRRRSEDDREPAAQRPPVREPRGDDSRRRPRLPQRPDQEHAVLAADRGRQRPQPELPDRRRRQQRRHGRRPAAALPARSGVRSST